MRVRWIAFGRGAVPADRNARWQGALMPLIFGGRDVAWSWTGRFQQCHQRDLAAVTFACFSLRCRCFEQRVHSDLYDGLTWPDTGFASFD